MNGIKQKPSILKANIITNNLSSLLARVHLKIYKTWSSIFSGLIYFF